MVKSADTVILDGTIAQMLGHEPKNECTAANRGLQDKEYDDVRRVFAKVEVFALAVLIFAILASLIYGSQGR